LPENSNRKFDWIWNTNYNPKYPFKNKMFS
jgi:hypothetical protein